MRRRDFIRTIGAVGAYALGTRCGLAQSLAPAASTTTGATATAATTTGAATAAKLASDRILLGKSGIKASRLAMGTGTHGSNGSSNQTRLGTGGVADLFKSAYDQGVNFWDSADQYGSHPHLKAALKDVPRDKVVILTKTHATTSDEMKRDLDRFRQELGTDYIDILLLHCMTDPDWPQLKAGAMDVISEAAQKGIVRMHGTSCHTFEALTTASNTDWVQVDLARINPAGVLMDAAPEKVVPVLRDMKKKGKAIIGMKIFGEGRLKDRMDECLQFALGLDCVDCFTIGSESKDQLADLAKRIPIAAKAAADKAA